MTDNTDRTRSSSFYNSLPTHQSQNFQLEENWIDRPVRLLHVPHGKQGDSDNFLLIGKKKELEQTRFFRELEEFGYFPQDVVGIQEDSRLATFSWPRNMEWKALPSISDPSFKVLYGRYTVLDEFGYSNHADTARIESTTRDSIATNLTKMLVISAKNITDHLLASIGHLAQGFPNLRMMQFDGVNLKPVPDLALKTAMDMHKANERFVYNHAVNMIVITSRAYLKLARQEGRSQAYVEAFAPCLNDFRWRLGHPLSLQALYAIRKLGRPVEDETHLTSSAQLDRVPWLMTHTLPFFKNTEDGDYFTWKGTGRYPEWSISLGKVAPGAVKDRRGVHASPHYLFRLLNSLLDADYVGVYNDHIRITPMGEAFLDLIGYEAEDSDVLLRWRNGELLGKPEDVPAMDRWLNRSFRSIKRRVSSFPASPVTEHVEAPWPAAATKRLYVFGHRTDFSPTELLRDDVRAFLTWVEEHENTNDPINQRFGVVRHGMGFGEPSHAIGVWAGVPVAVLSRSTQKLAEIDLFADWSQFRAMYDGITSQLPAWINREAAPSLIDANATADDQVDLNIPPKLKKTPTRIPGNRVYLGYVLTLDDLDKCTPDLREYAMLQSLSRGFSSITDGVNTFGYGKSITFVYGSLVGYHDASTDKIFVQTDISPARTARMENNLQDWRTDIPLVFDHPDISDFGYWLVTPSGKVSALNPTDREDPRIVCI